VGLLRNRILIR